MRHPARATLPPKSQTPVGLSQTLLLADRSNMDHIIEAIRKIHAHSAALAKAAEEDLSDVET